MSVEQLINLFKINSISKHNSALVHCCKIFQLKNLSLRRIDINYVRSTKRIKKSTILLFLQRA